MRYSIEIKNLKYRKHISNSYLYSSSSIKYRRNLPDSGAFRRINRVFEDKSRGAIAKNIHFARVILASSDPLCETMMGGAQKFCPQFMAEASRDRALTVPLRTDRSEVGRAERQLWLVGSIAAMSLQSARGQPKRCRLPKRPDTLRR